MISPTDQQRGLMGWGISVLFHVGLVLAGTLALFHPAQFRVETAVSSTEVEFAAEPTPAPAVTPPTPTPEFTPTLPVPTPPTSESSLQPIHTTPVPELTESAVATATPMPAKTHSQKPATTPKTSPSPVTSRASRGALDAQPDELHNAPPEYPEASRVAHEEGTVILRVQVTALGTASYVAIRESSGYSRLDQAAREAIAHWKFHPAVAAGIPVSSEVDVPVHFKLEQ